MHDKKNYANGQPVYELADNKLTYYFKNGKVKAFGPFINNLMEGEWIFYRETGQLWQVAILLVAKKMVRGFDTTKTIKLSIRKHLKTINRLSNISFIC